MVIGPVHIPAQISCGIFARSRRAEIAIEASPQRPSGGQYAPDFLRTCFRTSRAISRMRCRSRGSMLIQTLISPFSLKGFVDGYERLRYGQGILPSASRRGHQEAEDQEEAASSRTGLVHRTDIGGTTPLNRPRAS